MSRFKCQKKYLSELCEPLKYLFILSIINGVFPDDLTTERVTRICKADSNSNVSNYRQISMLPCFSQILEQIMYNHLRKQLNDQNILYDKQFGFRTDHSTDHALESTSWTTTFH